LSLELIEQLPKEAQESSNSWNNAGTGHAANCELNYTPLEADGSVNISKALEVNVEFDLSRQLWSYLIKKGAIQYPTTFINPVPHMSFVEGDAHVSFLKKRHAALSAHHCFHGMEFTEDPAKIAQWAPLVMQGRDPKQKIAATRIISGADVSYGSLTSHLLQYLKTLSGFKATFLEQVTHLQREADGRWRITIKNKTTSSERVVIAKFVFLGAGGGALPLLQKTGIPEADGYAGFPVSGIWLRYDAQDIVSQHEAKVYGMAAVGSPPMSVPHLDTRIIDGKRSLLFGPYAGFSTKFLKNGSWLDLFKSIRLGNLLPIAAVGISSMTLVKYLVGQVLQTKNDQFDTLKQYYPGVNPKEWYLEVAGQRVQIIKKDKLKTGVLEFGTEIVESADSSVVALLGASPGASTAASIMMNVIERMPATGLLPEDWKTRMKAIIQSYGSSLITDEALCNTVRAETAAVLGLKNIL
jgi:malate dehydrogenase (quinone)